jgi:copper chaperone CopZ
MGQLTIEIKGMSCGHCLNAVRQALAQAPGVQVESLHLGRAIVSYDPAVTGPAEIESAIERAGYAATAGPPLPSCWRAAPSRSRE